MPDQLSERQLAEKLYHDEKHRDANALVDQRKADSAYNFYWGLVGNVKGLKVLDYGCGNGWLSVLLAKSGADVCGIDISEELIKKADALRDRQGLGKRISFKVMAAEDLTFPDRSFDLALGSAILHHTDIDRALSNISRVLKPGGRAIFIEPLNQNIFLKLWRKLTPWRRSPAEKALTDAELAAIKRIFPGAKFHFFDLASIFTKGLLVISPENRLLLYANSRMERFDAAFIKRCPSLGKYCAVVVLELLNDRV